MTENKLQTLAWAVVTDDGAWYPGRTNKTPGLWGTEEQAKAVADEIGWRVVRVAITVVEPDGG